jgi:hypothetical protein
VVAFHGELRVSPTVAEEITFRNKNPETPELGRLCNGLKAPIMKHQHQEDGEPRGPLILLTPASNLVAILSLDWLDCTKQPAVSAKEDRWEQSSKSVGDRERLRQNFRGGQLTLCPHGAADI